MYVCICILQSFGLSSFLCISNPNPGQYVLNSKFSPQCYIASVCNIKFLKSLNHVQNLYCSFGPFFNL